MGDDDAADAVRMLHEFSKRGNDAYVLEQLDENHVPVDAPDSLGNTALHWAAGGGHMGTIEILLEHKANVNAKGKNGDTPLHRAAWRSHTNAIRRLLEVGADKTVKNDEGKLAADLTKDNSCKRM